MIPVRITSPLLSLFSGGEGAGARYFQDGSGVHHWKVHIRADEVREGGDRRIIRMLSFIDVLHLTFYFLIFIYFPRHIFNIYFSFNILLFYTFLIILGNFMTFYF